MGNGRKGLSAERDYPLATKRPDLVQSASGLHLDEITLDKVVAGQIKFEDIKTRPETLEYQAQIAESAGRPNLATNLRRAAEMTRIPDARVLEIYNALRPYRSTKQDLLDIAEELDSQYQANGLRRPGSGGRRGVREARPPRAVTAPGTVRWSGSSASTLATTRPRSP